MWILINNEPYVVFNTTFYIKDLKQSHLDGFRWVQGDEENRLRLEKGLDKVYNDPNSTTKQFAIIVRTKNGNEKILKTYSTKEEAEKVRDYLLEQVNKIYYNLPRIEI